MSDDFADYQDNVIWDLRNQLTAKDIELARWKEIAIEERARYIAQASLGDIENFRTLAAKELSTQIDQEAGYLKRLEAEFLDQYPYAEIGWSQHGYPLDFSEEEREGARVALTKIREGK